MAAPTTHRIDTRFAELRASGRKALVPFITAGDPSLDVQLAGVVSRER